MALKARSVALLVLVVSVALATAIFAVPFLTRPAERGATLTITLVNGDDSMHIVYITTRYAGNWTRVDFRASTVPPGEWATARLSLGHEVVGEPLEVVFEDAMAGESSTRTWTPTEGASDSMDYQCPPA